jgi:hypothetical protein
MAFYQSKDRFILCKKESSYGTDANPANTDALFVRSIEIEPLQADEVEREVIRGYGGNYDVILANQRAAITLEVEFAASGTAGTAPRWGPLFEACGHSETISPGTSVTYAPLGDDYPSATIEYYVRKGTNTLLHKLTGCRGSFSMNCEVSSIPTITFTMVGIYNAPVDGADPGTSYSNQAAPTIFNKANTTSFTLMGFAAAMQSYSFDQAQNTIYKELVGGTKEVLTPDRRPSGTAVIEAPDLDDHDYFADGTGTSTGSNTFQQGQSAGNILTWSAPQTDISTPSYSDSDGIQMLNIPFRATPSTAGNDEYSLVAT